MQTMTATVGPLAASGATKVALSQSPPGIGYIVLNGALGSFTANNIALSQSITGATAVIINGSTNAKLVQTGATGAYLGSLQRIYITSAGNDSSITFAIVGTIISPTGITLVRQETLTGANTSTVCSSNYYSTIIFGISIANFNV